MTGPDAPFLRLCEQATYLVLQRLPVKALACLGCVCSALHSLVDSQPEQLWRAAAELAGYKPEHPVHRAPSTRAWLQRQARLHANMATGRFNRHSLTLPEGKVAPDLRLHAALERDRGKPYLHVRQLPSGRTLQRWALPANLDYPGHGHYTHWHGDHTVALGYGELTCTATRAA